MRKPWGCCLQYAPSSLYLADAAGCPGQPSSRSNSFRVSAPDTLSPLGFNTTCPLGVNKTVGNSRRRAQSSSSAASLREPTFSCAKPRNCRDSLIDTRARAFRSGWWGTCSHGGMLEPNARHRQIAHIQGSTLTLCCGVYINC
jgi:hypothetical protein